MPNVFAQPESEFIGTTDPKFPDRRQQVVLCAYGDQGIGFDHYVEGHSILTNISPADARRLAFRLFVAADAAEGRS